MNHPEGLSAAVNLVGMPSFALIALLAVVLVVVVAIVSIAFFAVFARAKSRRRDARRVLALIADLLHACFGRR